MIEVLALEDESGHWYVIPKNLYSKWEELENKMDSENQIEFELAEEEFIEIFGQYMTGGDLNIVQLYAEI